MFKFSNPHSWANDIGVQQVLVFAHESMELRFNETMAERQLDDNACRSSYLSDTNAGALYKLRSIDQVDGYEAVIRCGVTNKRLWKSVQMFDTPELAISSAKTQLQLSLIVAFES